MQDDAYKEWLTGQGLAASSISTRLSDARRIEEMFGDLDLAFERDGGASIIAALTYTTADRAAGKPNTTGIEIDGDILTNLSTYKSALTSYLRFLKEADGTPSPSQADRIRQYVAAHYAEPAKARGAREFSIVSGDVHRELGLANAMPAVCRALDSRLFAELIDAELVAREGPAQSSTVSYRFRFADYSPFNIAAAEELLRRRYGSPIATPSGADNRYIIAFELPDYRQIALEREGVSVRIWLEDSGASTPPPCEQFVQYTPTQGRQSNLPSRLRHAPSSGTIPRTVFKITVPDRATLIKVLTWYDAQGSASAVLTREAVLRALDECDRDGVEAFLERHGFRRPKTYWIAEQNRLYPCKAIANVALRLVQGPDTPIWDATRSREIIARLGFTVVDSESPSLDLQELERLRQRFLERFPDFEPRMFAGTSGRYCEIERNYKDALLENARRALAEEGSLSDQDLGGQFLDLLIGPESGLLGWRTDGRIRNLRNQFPGVLEAEAGSLVRNRDNLPAAVDTFVANIWPILTQGMEKSLPYSESRNIPSMLLAFASPNVAFGINTEPLRKIYKALTGKNLFGQNPMSSAEYSEVLQFARTLFGIFEQWGWQPRDLWDVQSFIWAVKDSYQTTTTDTASHDQEAHQPMPNPTNLILYGPPGTGKTYQTALEAVKLCDGSAPDDRDATKARYDALVEAGQIRFVTFHQSYSYEDFVEGLRPVTDADDGEGSSSSAGFRLEPKQGIFREISALADVARRNTGRTSGFDLTGRQFYKMSLGRAGSEDHIFDAAIEGGYIVLGWGGEVDWSDPQYEDFEAIRQKWNEIEPDANGMSSNISQTWYFRSKMKEGDLVIVSDGNFKFRAIGEVVGPYKYAPTETRDYNHRRSVNWLLVLDESLPIEIIHDGKLVQRSCYELKSSRMKLEALSRLLPGNSVDTGAAPDQFVLIIDEINRANISKVFGELITLIEPDKRLGSDNMLSVKLPYSGDIFGVPNNLHILGTMNTADRSIALLDTALRRRFTFKELMPDAALLEEAAERTGINLPALLATLNERIEFLFDREHQIGHAYFINCQTSDDIDDVMRFKIIPLLAEYFYEDWNKVALVLGDADGAGNFIKRTQLMPPAGMQNEGFEDARYRWEVCDQFPETAYDQFA